MTHMQYKMMMKVQADYGFKKKRHRKQQIHLHTQDLEQMLIRGRSPAIIGGSTSNQHRPNCHVPAGSEINRPPPERTRRIKPPSAVSHHQANTGFSIAVYTTMHFHMTIYINKKQYH